MGGGLAGLLAQSGAIWAQDQLRLSASGPRPAVSHPFPPVLLRAMTSSDELKELKLKMSPLVACCCYELSCTASEIMNPPLMGTFKVLCCAGSVATECCCISCETDPCWSEERGCCEIASKFLCCYTETQFPPGKDIGCGCCGIAFCRSSDDAPPAEE